MLTKTMAKSRREDGIVITRILGALQKIGADLENLERNISCQLLL
jgi:hypothetical protein